MRMIPLKKQLFAMNNPSGNASPPVVVIALLSALALHLPRATSFVHDVHRSSSRRTMSIEAIASPLDQVKLDFLGSLANAYDINPSNTASTLFLRRLVDQVTPESITRDMIESFEELATGKWRIVYAEDYSTSFGFGSLLGEFISGEVELGNDGSIASNIQCSNPTPYHLSVEGTYGTARNNMLIKVNHVQAKQLQSGDEDNGLLSELKGVPASITQSIWERSWPALFSGMIVVDLAYIDDSLAVFNLDLLGRMNGKRICARKEPDFF